MKNKSRHNPNKPQNNYGGDYNCPQYDIRNDGIEWCHDEGNSKWNEFINWCKKDNDGKLLCKGNQHTCYKLKLRWLASLPKNKHFLYNS